MLTDDAENNRHGGKQRGSKGPPEFVNGGRLQVRCKREMLGLRTTLAHI